jgi:hypothetical protein
MKLDTPESFLVSLHMCLNTSAIVKRGMHHGYHTTMGTSGVCEINSDFQPNVFSLRHLSLPYESSQNNAAMQQSVMLSCTIT